MGKGSGEVNGEGQEKPGEAGGVRSAPDVRNANHSRRQGPGEPRGARGKGETKENQNESKATQN